jgi:hypothetical protein
MYSMPVLALTHTLIGDTAAALVAAAATPGPTPPTIVDAPAVTYSVFCHQRAAFFA